MKQLLFACLVFVGCNTPEPTQINTPIGMSHLLDTTTGTNSIALGTPVYDIPIVSDKDIKNLNGKGAFGGYTIKSSSPDLITGYSNLSIGDDNLITLDSTTTSSSIRFAGSTGIIYKEGRINNRYFSDTNTVEKPVVIIVHDSITSHLEFYPAQVTYVNRYYVRGYYYNYDIGLKYYPVDTSLVSSKVILVDGLVKPSNLSIIE